MSFMSTYVIHVHWECQEATGNQICKIIQDWALEAKMKISVEKTKHILLNGKLAGRPQAIRLENQSVQFVSQISYLGITIDSVLTFLLKVKEAGEKACTPFRKITRNKN